MIFSQFRDSVDEICSVLSQHQPLVRPVTFIGQSTSKKGKGYTQKDQISVILSFDNNISILFTQIYLFFNQQIKVISKFQSGEYNVIVATCIGEEGLDLGDVDMIICYDSQASPIRMLQRIGRTGRLIRRYQYLSFH